MFLRTIAAATLLLFPFNAAKAQSLGSGLYYSGFLQAEVVSGSSSAQGLYGDLTVGYMFNGQSSFSTGVELSGIVAEYSGATSSSELYGVAFAETRWGRFSIGVPRPVSDGLLPEIIFSSVGNLAQQYTFASRSPIHFLAISSNEIFSGLGYRRTIGQTKVGASFHRYAAQQVSILDLAARRQYDNITISGAVQVTFLPVGLGHRQTSQFGVEADYGRSQLAFLYSDTNWLTGLNSYYAAYKYAITDKTRITASVAHFSNSTSSVLGLNGKRSLGSNAYIQAGIYATTASGSSPIYSLSFGTKH